MTSRVVAHGIGNGLRADSAVENGGGVAIFTPSRMILTSSVLE